MEFQTGVRETPFIRLATREVLTIFLERSFPKTLNQEVLFVGHKKFVQIILTRPQRMIDLLQERVAFSPCYLYRLSLSRKIDRLTILNKKER